jgi:hypothetical protein
VSCSVLRLFHTTSTPRRGKERGEGRAHTHTHNHREVPPPPPPAPVIALSSALSTESYANGRRAWGERGGGRGGEGKEAGGRRGVGWVVGSPVSMTQGWPSDPLLSTHGGPKLVQKVGRCCCRGAGTARTAGEEEKQSAFSGKMTG